MTRSALSRRDAGRITRDDGWLAGPLVPTRVILPDIGAFAHARAGESGRRRVDRVRTSSRLLEVLMSDSATVVIPESLPLFAPVQLAAAGFLARYSGRTRAPTPWT